VTERQDLQAAAPLHERLLALSREAHERRQHEVAYHALTAAMHAAADVGDGQALAEVGREAENQIAWIDRYEPMHRLSTASARLHQHPGVYAMLARQVAAHAQMQAPRATSGHLDA
jgi:hypothetical protein